MSLRKRGKVTLFDTSQHGDWPHGSHMARRRVLEEDEGSKPNTGTLVSIQKEKAEEGGKRKKRKVTLFLL